MRHDYLDLKLSRELFKKTPEELSPPEQKRLGQIAAKQKSIEDRVLASSEAAKVFVPAAALATQLREIRRRYKNDAEFDRNLKIIGLEEAELKQAVERDMRVEAVLEKVASGSAPVSAVDAEIYYRLHPVAFDRPEARRLRHILITYESAKGRSKAAAQLESLRAKLHSAESFGKAALHYSQCPTAMEGGQLGVLKRGQLYPELEAAAFALSESEISAVLESPVGLHILHCDEILQSGMLPLAKVRERIVEHLTDRRRRAAQKAWIKDLLAG